MTIFITKSRLIISKNLFLAALITLFSITFLPAPAQNLVIDSLQKALRQADTKTEPIIVAELARATCEKNIDEAIRRGQDALYLAKKNKDDAAKAFCYATVAHLLVQKDQSRLATAYIDSAVKAAAHAQDPVLASYAWLRKGWFELVKGDNEKAMSGFLQAEKMLDDREDKRSLTYKALINHYIASMYAYGNDTLKQHKYAAAALQSAKQNGVPDDLMLGYMSVGHSYFSSFEKNMLKRNLLETSLNYFRQALGIYQRNREKVLIQSNASLISLNMANAYFKYYPVSYKDSVYKYVDTALAIARRTHGREIIANCYGILSEYALRQKDFAAAERYLQIGISELANGSGVDITRARLMQGLANVAETSGNLSKALTYYKQYIAYYSKVFDAQKLANTQQLEEEYQAVKRENEIVHLRERADYNHRLNWLYAAIGSISIILLVLLLTSYHYKLKSSIKQKQLTEQEKEEAELLAKLQQTEAQRLELEKQEAELKASLREEESARLQAQQELLQDRTEWLEKELLAGTLKIEEKNGILELLKEKTRDADAQGMARQIGRIINQNLRMDKNIEEQQSLSQIHPGFFNALQERAEQGLTRLDLKYCAYILMGLDNKEIAGRLGVEPKSIRMARYRIKQKLKLDKDANLDQALRMFEKAQV